MGAIGYRDSYGLEIANAIVEETGKRMPMGSLYPILHSLEGKGLVESYWGEETAERGGARRRYYKLTGSGVNALQEHHSVFTGWVPASGWSPMPGA